MNEFIKILLALSFSGTLLITILLISKPFYKNRLSKKWQYYIYFLVIIRLLLPFTSRVDITDNFFKQINTFSKNTIEYHYFYFEDNAQTKNNKITSTSNTGKEKPNKNNSNLLLSKCKKIIPYIKKGSFFLWFIIAISLFIRKITQYQSFINYIKVGQSEITSLEFWELLGNQIEELHIKTPINLYENNLISSPLLIGFFHPCIMLPSIPSSNTDFENIFRHELIHFKRKDMFYKWLVQFTICLYWFNPFIYLMGFEINRLCELSCDEAVIKGLDENGKKAYGDTLLNTIKTGNAFKSSIASVTLNEGKKLLKERMDSIMKFKNKTKVHSTISLILTFMLGITAVTLGDIFIKNTNIIAEAEKIVKKDNTKKQASSIFNDNDLTLIDNYLTNNKVIYAYDKYNILCGNATKKDIPSGCGDGITITIVTKSSYASMGIDSLDTIVEDITESCTEWLSSKTITKKQAKLAIGLAVRLQENNGEIKSLTTNTAKKYKQWNITRDTEGHFYYKKQRVSILLELKSDHSFQNMYYDKKGTINLKIIKSKKGQIKKVSYLTKKEVKKYSQ